MSSCYLCGVPSPGEMGPMVASTLKLGIAILNGGNSTVQQVFQCSATSVSVMYLTRFIMVLTLLLSAVYLKVPYYEKHVFSGLYIYKLVLPEPANSQNQENK